MSALRLVSAAGLAFVFLHLAGATERAPFATPEITVVHLVAGLPLIWLTGLRLSRPQALVVLAAAILTVILRIDGAGSTFLIHHAIRSAVSCGIAAGVLRLVTPADSPESPSRPAWALAGIIAVGIPAQMVTLQTERLAREAGEQAAASKFRRAERTIALLRALGSRREPPGADQLSAAISSLEAQADALPDGIPKARALAQLDRLDEAVRLTDDSMDGRMLRASIWQDRQLFDESDAEYRLVLELEYPGAEEPTRERWIAGGFAHGSAMMPLSPRLMEWRQSQAMSNALRAMNALCFNARQRPDPAGAVKLADEGLARFPFLAAHWHMQRGLARELADQPREARREFETAIDLDPKLKPRLEPTLDRLKRGPGCAVSAKP